MSRPALHPTTVALLEAADAWETTAAVLEAAGRWREAGSPDLTTPTPDRLAELEARIKTLFELAGNRRQDSDDQLAQVTELEARLGALTGRVVALEALSARVAALEQPTASSSEPPKPPRFVPTEPGWYWARLTDGQPAVRWFSGFSGPGTLAGQTEWLAPVAPYAPPTRTEAEARAKPMRGDRWYVPEDRQHYTVTDPALRVRYVWADGTRGYGPIGAPDHTYLGNFAHELEEP